MAPRAEAHHVPFQVRGHAWQGLQPKPLGRMWLSVRCCWCPGAVLTCPMLSQPLSETGASRPAFSPQQQRGGCCSLALAVPSPPH